MERRDAGRRRLIVNADDFGRSSSINRAVIRAHREGILTTASLMVNEAAFDEAVALAAENPRLGVGLHLTLLCGHATLSRTRIPGLVNERREFSNGAVTAGLRYFLLPSLRVQIETELEAQFERFATAGLPLDHVNGHLHIHLHPVVFSILMRRAQEWRIARVRLTCDPFRLNARLAGGAWLYRASHAAIYGALPVGLAAARHPLHGSGFRTAAARAGGRSLRAPAAGSAAARRFRTLLASLA
jgi:hopanoid biosynthesis associated protein HpnK